MRRVAQNQIRAGDFTHLVMFQKPGGDRDATGERLTTWADIAPAWCSIRPLTAREQFLAAGRLASTTHVVATWWTPAASQMLASWRIKFGERLLILDGPPRNIDERNVWLEMDCTEGQRTE